MYPAAPDSPAIAQLHDHARREARRLRRESVNEFWCNAAHLMAQLVRRRTHPTPTITQKA